MRIFFLVFTILFSSSLFSQNKVVDFKPNFILFEIENKYSNEEEMDNQIYLIAQKMDSVFISKTEIKEEDNLFNDVNIPTIALLLDPRYHETSISKATLSINDSTTIFKSFDAANNLNLHLKYYKSNTYYDVIDPITNTTVASKEKIKLFDENCILEIKEFRNDKKVINSFQCFKVTVSYSNSFQFNEVNLTDIIPNTRIHYELYVTEKIKNTKHIFLLPKTILDKYYPLELKYTSDILPGYEKTIKIKEIK